MSMNDSIFRLALSPNYRNDGICFAARESGLYRSEDGGISWQNTFSSLPTDDVISALDVCLSPTFPNDQCLYTASLGVVLRSLDGANTWEAVKLQDPLPVISSLAVTERTGGELFVLAGTLEDGIFVSSNGGAGFTAWNYGLVDKHVYCLLADKDEFFAGTESGIFRSRNGGRLWEEVNFCMELAPVNTLLKVDSLLLAGTESKGCYLSRDEGVRWQQAAPDVLTGAVNDLRCSNRGWLLAVTDECLFLSDDEGENWRLHWQITGNITIHACAAPFDFDHHAPMLIALADGTIHRINPA